MATGWHGALQPSTGLPSFTLEEENRLILEYQMHWVLEIGTKAFLEAFGFSSASFAKVPGHSHQLDSLESQGARHPFF